MNKQIREYSRSIALGALVGIGLAVVFAAGFFLRDLLEIPRLVREPNTYPLLSEVKSLVDRFYLRDVPDTTQEEYSVIRGYLSALGDPNTYFIDPPVAKSESDVLAGTYGGAGVQVQRPLENDRYLLFPLEDSPAKRAGVENGDILLKINGQDITTRMQQDAVDQLLRGEVKDGSGVELTLQKIDNDVLTLFVPFEVINVPSVFWRVLQDTPNIGYLQILRFTNRTPEEVAQAIQDLRASQVEALVLDLRGNSGGLLQESLDVADEFIDEGVIAFELRRNGEQAYDAQDGGLLVDAPIAVLINGGTASAAELLAGAIKDAQRGQLIGQKTFGKGTIQQIYGLSDQSSVHITSAEWITPARTVIDRRGLQPDIVVTPDSGGLDAELATAVEYLITRMQSQ